VDQRGDSSGMAGLRHHAPIDLAGHDMTEAIALRTPLLKIGPTNLVTMSTLYFCPHGSDS
jgi:hypothetical protein